jgi:hypothetical protein
MSFSGSCDEFWAGIPEGGGTEPDPEFEIESFTSLLGVKYGILFAGTSTRTPVFRLRPVRAWRSRVRKLPNPRISTLSRDRRARTMLLKMAMIMNSSKGHSGRVSQALINRAFEFSEHTRCNTPFGRGLRAHDS